MFLLIVALAVRDPNNYEGSISPLKTGECGWPTSWNQTSSQMKQEHLQLLYDNIDAVKFVGMIFSTLC